VFNPSNFAKGDRVVYAHDPHRGEDVLTDKDSAVTIQQDTSLAVYVDRLQDSGFLYAIENPQLSHATEHRMEQLMLPRGDDEDSEEHFSDLVTPTCFEPEDSMCLVGLHNISYETKPVSSTSQNITVFVPDTPSQNGVSYLTIAFGAGVAVSLLSGTAVILKRNQTSRSHKTPKKKKKEKKQDPKLKETNGIITIGKLEISPVILGYGSSGTIVFEGKLDGRRVAVKRMLSAFYKAAQREIQILLESDTHNNVVTYYAKVTILQY
jgi:hypothetical protein